MMADTEQAQATASPAKATATASPAAPLGQYIILAAVVSGWAFALVMFWVFKVAAAELIADGGWAALLVSFRADFGQGAQATATQQPPPAP